MNRNDSSDSEENLSELRAAAVAKSRAKLDEAKQNGFHSIVKRIQLAARIAGHGQGTGEDFYNEDAKLNFHSKSPRLRRRSRVNSIVPGGSLAAGKSPFLAKIADHISNRKAYVGGEIKFLQKDRQYELKPFVVVEPCITTKNLAHIFNQEWHLEAPKIITLIVSGESSKQYWKNGKQIKNFQIGVAKAAMSTNMWILANGINCGATAYVCSAVDVEYRKANLKNPYKLENSFRMFGIARENFLTYGAKLSQIQNQTDLGVAKNIICIENSGYGSKGEKLELNPDMSHFFILKSSLNKNHFILNLIDLFTKKELRTNDDQPDEIPLVSILVEGEPENADLILNLIKRHIPVVVLQGSGGMADIIAFAYNRITDVFPDQRTWDPDYIEEFIKPWLAKKIALQYPECGGNSSLVRNLIREQVIECVRLSKQDGRQYLMLLDMHKINSCDLTNLQEYLLNALLDSRRNTDSTCHDQFLKDFDLIVDWNCANVAKNLLFSLNPVNITELLKPKFFHILVRPDREAFVELFLADGFQLHRFLTPSKLARLYRVIHEDEFFHAVCWETILSKSPNARQNKFFIEHELNWLIEFCTGLENFVDSEQLHLNSLAMYQTDSLSAERRALTLLAIWAVSQNRYELAKVFWKYSDHPVHLALVISMMFERLSWHVFDTNLKAELQQNSKRFAQYANGVLDRCYNDNITLAYNVLREKICDWDFHTAVDIAASAQLKRFLAHPCCQKWLTNTFQGQIRLRELTWGICTVPVPMKILLCCFLVFPMYIWVRFNDPDDREEENSRTVQKDSEEEVDFYDKMYTSVEMKNLPQDAAKVTFKPERSLPPPPPQGITNKAFLFDDIPLGFRRTSTPNNHLRNNNNNNNNPNYQERVFVKKQPPLWKMIRMMWSSPISKFYTSQVFYVIFLILVSLAALYPNCGSVTLDSIVCLWSLLIAISYSRHICILFFKYSSVSIYSKILEILLIFSFVIVFTITRVFGIHFYPLYWQKIIIALMLLYFYYRLISVYLPISSTLGPLLYRFRLMITVDFVNYMRITMVILIANSIAIRALEYPYHDLSSETISEVFHKGILSLFSGPPAGPINIVTDVERENKFCGTNIHLMDNSTFYQEDPLIIYIFVFQYFIILRMIAHPLLFSIFAATASKWVTEVDSIWKFQRYLLVIDFANRLALPEPLSLFYYVYVLLNNLFALCNKSLNWAIFDRKIRKTQSQNVISPEDCMYWKQLASEYIDSERKKVEESQIIHKQWDCIRDITEEIEYEKKVLREVKGKMFELERYIQIKVEDLNRNSNSGAGSAVDPYPLSRQSPYPETDIFRFPLAPKYLSWRVSYFSYEPVCYTRSKNEFPPDLQPYVDEDIIKMKTESINQQQKHFKYLAKSSTMPPSFKWNHEDSNILEDGGSSTPPSSIIVDRRSWHNGKRLEYSLEDEFLPLNPFGRTGLRGKGQLPRWGPNHHCILIVAHISSSLSPAAISKETKANANVMEQPRIKFLFETTTMTSASRTDPERQSRLQLIKRYINNEKEMVEFLRKSMARLFKKCLKNLTTIETMEKLEETVRSSPALEFRLLQSGYWDHPENTDNAWKEANVYLVTITTSVNQSFPFPVEPKLVWFDPEEQTTTPTSSTTTSIQSCCWWPDEADGHLINLARRSMLET